MIAPVPQLLIVIASTRPGRRGLPIGEWITQRAREHGAFDVEVADLAEINLPFMDEPNHPRMRKYTKQHTLDWSAQVDAADAFVFVMPEYNYGFNAALKNAVDYLNAEWNYKPAGIVSYGGAASGTRAAQMFKQVITTLKVVPLFEAVSMPFFMEFFNEDGELVPNEMLEQSATAMLNELVHVEAALRPLRSAAA